MRCLHCGERHSWITPTSCSGYAWSVHEDGRPLGIHERAWEEFQNWEFDLEMLDRYNWAYWRGLETVPDDQEWEEILEEADRQEAIRKAKEDFYEYMEMEAYKKAEEIWEGCETLEEVQHAIQNYKG